MHKDDCLFCQIIAKKIPSTIRYEDEEFLAFNDIHPIAPTHVLLIPKKPIGSLEEIAIDDVTTQAKLLQTARKIAQELGVGDNYKLFMNVGAKVQQVHHVHLHIYGGWDQKSSHQKMDRKSHALIQQ